MWLLHQLGGSIDTILRDNYESVVAMQDLKESLERIDSSFQFLLVAQELKDQHERRALETKARTAFAENWQRYAAAFGKEQENVTIHPTEDDLVARLSQQTDHYRRQGKASSTVPCRELFGMMITMVKRGYTTHSARLSNWPMRFCSSTSRP